MSAADVRESRPSDPSLACPVDNKLFLDAVKTPCCGTLYCEECIHTRLLENDFVCPKCGEKVPSLDKLIVDKPMRTRVGDYIDKVIKETQEAEEAAVLTSFEGATQDSSLDSASGANADYLYDQQQGGFDVNQLMTETIPQLQAQIAQISTMLQNPSLPLQVRQSTEFQYHQLQLQLQQAQVLASLGADINAVAAAAAAAAAQENSANLNFQQPEYQGQWKSAFSIQQPAGQDSAYQRLPVNRRRNNKRERPSDFLEIGGGDTEPKMPRYWE